MSAAVPAPDGWVSAGLDEAIGVLAREGSEFTADAVHADRFGLGWMRSGDVGGAFRRARARGLIRPVGFTVSKRSGRRHSILRVWVGGGGL